MKPDFEFIANAVRKAKQQREATIYPTLPQGFTLENEGRHGAVLYRKEDHILDIYWEMSGVEDYDILLYLDLSKWNQPEGKSISDEERNSILTELETFLKHKRIRSDAFAPLKRPLFTKHE